MNSDRKRKATRTDGEVCRSCEEPVDTVVERHKTMGVYVPSWTAGPCHNPRCEQFVPEEALIHSVRAAPWRDLAGWKHR